MASMARTRQYIKGAIALVLTAVFGVGLVTGMSPEKLVVASGMLGIVLGHYFTKQEAD